MSTIKNDREKETHAVGETFVEVLFPQKIGNNKETLTYSVPPSLVSKISIGQLVETPLRTKKVKGIILEISQQIPAYKTKPIVGIVENAPHLKKWQLDVMRWISDYYFSAMHRAIKMFLPLGLIKKKRQLELPKSNNAHYDFSPKHTLSDEQKKIIHTIKNSSNAIVLLQGITGSGKTEIYLHLADEQLKEKKQVLMLIPEISLTPQTVERFKDHFQQKISVIHSQLTPSQKRTEWLNIYNGASQIVIGSRSALFAPFQNLSLIIMDEEHDSSYKQDQSPRYHAREVGIMMAKKLGIKMIMGSATPSLETYYEAKKGKIQLLKLSERVNQEKGAKLPGVTIVDLREEIKKKNFSIFSELLHKKLSQKLKTKEQTLLFLNRRGAASAVICRECGYTVKCSECDVPMTYHKKIVVEDGIYETHRLICHHCGKIGKPPSLCPQCQSSYIRYLGLGTQRVEEETHKLFPIARVLRADRDTIVNKKSHEDMYELLKNHKVDVLVGTQMIAMGLHIPKINLVGVMLADLTLTLPSFRSSEKTFQLLTQVSGRAGRESDKGEVVIQTYIPDHYAIQLAAKHNYEGFYEQEIKLRKSLNYPPFSKLIKLTIKDKSRDLCMKRCEVIAEELEKYNENNEHLITHYPALIPRLKNIYRWHLLLTGPAPEKILKSIKNLENIAIDVDPLSTI